MEKQRFAQQLRKQMTEAERRLWYVLRNRCFSHVKFRRQVPLGQYIVDFVSFEKQLIIECDGGQHALREKQDERRTQFLESEGFSVIRFWNHDIFLNTEGVLMTIDAALKIPLPRPLPPPPPHGRGG